MKTFILSFLCIFNLLANANSPYENPYKQNNSEENYESFNTTNESIFPRHKRLDPELRNIVLDIDSERVLWVTQLMRECAQDPLKKCPYPLVFAGANDAFGNQMAKAVAEDADLPFIQINTPFLLNDDKKFSKETVKFINQIVNTPRKVIVTFAGLDCVIDSAYASNYAAAVSQLLTAFENNSNITVIGIIANPNRMPKFLKNKFLIEIYFYKDTSTVKQKKELLHYHLKKYKNTCDDKCEDYISNLLKTIDAERIAGIVERAEMNASLGQEKRDISQKNLEDAIKQYQENQKFFEKRK